MRRSVAVALAGFVLLPLGGAGLIDAQELEPRAYRALPVGFNYGLISYSFSSGNVLVDTTVPVEGLDLDVSTLTATYLRTLPLFGRSASVMVAQPWVLAGGSAEVEGEATSGSRTGLGDTRLKLIVNLLGAPAMSPREFAGHSHERSLGASLALALPTGRYDHTKAINFGANRWGVKPEIGYSSERGRWITDAALGVWLFSENDEGFGGTTIRQEPIGSLQVHASYNFEGGVWLSLDANYYRGGRTEVDGEKLANLQRNSRIGLTLSIPLGRRDSLKVAGSTGAYTRFGADFDTGSLSYQRRFGGPEMPAPSTAHPPGDGR